MIDPPNDPLRSQLQATLGSAYIIERELGGGGMSRVFVAEEVRLGRRVVVKLLSPELAAGISAERFERETRMAASLQQANIVQVLSAGDMDGLPFYTMPFVEGESLRTRLAEPPELSVREVLRILGDVARALQYAHERGIIHRDIKPDNVLLSGGTAVVTDFGIAKALSAARTNVGAAETLTQLGTSIGTPSYMAPEQAAGDPDADQRVDIYAFGCLAYELLTGNPPFHGRAPQRILAAHMTEAPKPLSELRPDVPAALAALIMRCLAKDAAERPQTAGAIVEALDAVPSVGAMAATDRGLVDGPAEFRRALMVYVACAVGVAAITKAATIVIGLPDWVFPTAIVVMLLGLPVILLTGYVQSVVRRTRNAPPVLTPGGGAAPQATMDVIALKASPYFSWRRASRGGVIAVVAFVVVVLGFMVTRAMGIGPAASLFAKGVIKEEDRLLVADFDAPPADSSLGSVVSEGVRSNLAQSKAITVVPTSAVTAALARMRKAPTARLDFAIAREMAQREGYKAVVDGKVTAVSGGGYILTARLVSAETGDELASFRESARDAGALIPTIDKLTSALRGKLGESLKSVRAAPSLARATTASLPALRKYTEGVRAGAIEQNFPKAIAAYEEAIRLDTTFALAYRGASVAYANAGLDPERVQLYREKAFRFRDHLPDSDRAFLEGAYYHVGRHADRQLAIQGYRRALELDSSNVTLYNLLGGLYTSERRFAEAESLLKAGLARDSMPSYLHANLIAAELLHGETEQALRSWSRFIRIYPKTPSPLGWSVVAAKYGIDSAGAECGRFLQADDLQQRAAAQGCVVSVALTHGRLAAGLTGLRRRLETDSARGVRNAGFGLVNRVNEAFVDAAFLGRKGEAVHVTDVIAPEVPLVDTPISMERIPLSIIRTYAVADRPDKARQYFNKWIAALDTAGRRVRSTDIHLSLARIAVAEGKYDAAVREFLAADTLYDGQPTACATCIEPELGAAYDLAGRHDEAMATFEKYLASPKGGRWQGSDATYLAGIYKRLGELYEEKNDLARAADNYGKFIALWKNADAELQPRVAEAKVRLAAVLKREARTR